MVRSKLLLDELFEDVLNILGEEFGEEFLEGINEEYLEEAIMAILEDMDEDDFFEEDNFYDECEDCDEACNDFKIVDLVDRIIVNGPATIVWWTDGTKTVSVCSNEDIFDIEKGLAMCTLKYLIGDGSYNDIFRLVSDAEYKMSDEEQEARNILNDLLQTKKLTDKQKEALQYILNNCHY